MMKRRNSIYKSIKSKKKGVYESIKSKKIETLKLLNNLERKPSQELEDYWIYAERKDGKYPNDKEKEVYIIKRKTLTNNTKNWGPPKTYETIDTKYVNTVKDVLDLLSEYNIELSKNEFEKLKQLSNSNPPYMIVKLNSNEDKLLIHVKKMPLSGKWLIFVNRNKVDEIWAKIKLAVEEGKLGNIAKVSTAKPRPTAANRDEHVICVYTYDWTNKRDVMKIREELRKLGIVWKIPYKSDEDTIMGKYTKTGYRGIKKYYI
jgi:hypothetical protein